MLEGAVGGEKCFFSNVISHEVQVATCTATSYATGDLFWTPPLHPPYHSATNILFSQKSLCASIGAVRTTWEQSGHRFEVFQWQSMQM